MKKNIGLVVVALFLSVLTSAGVYSWSMQEASAKTALGEFSVTTITCGACAGKIASALQGQAGVGQVEVDVPSKLARVAFEPAVITPERIAALITGAGYPATFRNLNTSAQAQPSGASPYVARIGSRLVLNKDFEEALRLRVGGTAAEGSPELLLQAKRRLWDELLQRELMLASAEANGVVVTDTEVVQRIQQVSSGQSGFEAMVQKRYGSPPNFQRMIKEDMAITRNIEQNVLGGGVADTQTRQVKLDLWYRDLIRQTPVEIYDNQLTPAQSGGGCGGGCCGKG